MKQDILNLMTSYLRGWRTLADCAEWLAGIDWEDIKSAPELEEITGQMELLITEVSEEMRPEAEFWQFCSNIVAQETSTWYGKSLPIITGSSNDDNTRTPRFVVTSRVLEVV
ncbi:MAG: hypothetical protein GY845_09650 [Planctomycetes bacterium]|nr:hypothetical protein [Planctomycetota bacterium]